MPLPPPRRWFQFSLSTWFVLVAILAWAEMQWQHGRSIERPHYMTRSEFFSGKVPEIEGWQPTGGGFTKMSDGVAETTSYYYMMKRPQSYFGLLYPALALAAFVGWNAVWPIGRRVARRKAEQV